MMQAMVLTGPTASGKSALALTWAEQKNAVIINADAVQLYHEIPILAGTPTIEEMARIPHAAYNLFTADTQASVGLWLEHVVPCIRSTLAEGKLPLIVGGTGLYLKALLEGLSPIPAVSPTIQKAVDQEQQALGQEVFYQKLEAMDPLAAAQLRPSDRQRTARAMAVFLASGASLTVWQQQPRDIPLPEVQFTSYALLPPREDVYAACTRRFEYVFHHGAVEEVMAVLERYSEAAIRMRALGFGEIRDYLKGICTKEEAITAATLAIRHYAKRQMTWIRHQLPGVEVLSDLH